MKKTNILTLVALLLNATLALGDWTDEKLGSYVRYPNGKLHLMSQLDALHYCKELGKHLPTAREFAHVYGSVVAGIPNGPSGNGAKNDLQLDEAKEVLGLKGYTFYELNDLNLILEGTAYVDRFYYHPFQGSGIDTVTSSYDSESFIYFSGDSGNFGRLPSGKNEFAVRCARGAVTKVR